MGYSPWGCKQSDMTERLTLSISLLYLSTHYIILNIFDLLVLLVSICFLFFFSSLHFKFLVLIYFIISILKLIFSFVPEHCFSFNIYLRIIWYFFIGIIFMFYIILNSFKNNFVFKR